ncbi:hypothetical protein LguiA_020438 [Lonicera macranthoides]
MGDGAEGDSEEGRRAARRRRWERVDQISGRFPFVLIGTKRLCPRRKDFKERVGFSQSNPNSSSLPSSLHGDDTASANQDLASPSSRDKHELELDFKRYWEEFRSSSSEKEKEKALNLTVDVFCRLVKNHANVAQLITMLVETHIFSFVVARAFVTDIEQLKFSSKTRSLEVDSDGIRPGSNLLNAVEILVSGVYSCGAMVMLSFDLECIVVIQGNLRQKEDTSYEESSSVINENSDDDVGPARRLEIEGRMLHIMKALASHTSAAQSLVEDNSLQILFQMVANGSLIVFTQYKEGLVPLHTIQLHRHAMQILGLLLDNDNGSTAKYIRKHQLIKVLLLAVKDFNPDCGDSSYTMGIIDLLLACVELSYRPEAGGIKLREDIHNAHGYQFLVQFALILSRNQGFQDIHSKSFSHHSSSESLHTFNDVGLHNLKGKDGETSPQNISPTLRRLLDVLVNLAQTGPADDTGVAGPKGSKNSHMKPSGHGKRHSSSSDRLADEMWEKGDSKVKDLEAVQMLQDIFLKADSRELQAEVLNRMFKIFSSHLDNYKLCQQLRTVPLLILNMDGFPSSLQEIILKILEYVVTVVNCIPDQELLSLCCLLQQPITPELKHTILSFFVKLLSFDQQYKKVLREVGVLEVLLDDLKQHKLVLGPDQHTNDLGQMERKSSSTSFKKHLDSKDAILASPKLSGSGSGKFPIFEVEGTIAVAWDCLVSLLKKAEGNQMSFRSANGVTAALPFLVSDIHRPGILRVLSCMITEDASQVWVGYVSEAHPEELGALIDVSKSGMVTSTSGSQYRLKDDAKCDIFGALWRILGVNNSAQRVFGETAGFSLLLTTLHSFQSDREPTNQSSLLVCIKAFTYLLRLMTVGVRDNAVNRTKLHAIISSQAFYDLLFESGLFCVDCETQVIQLFLELALEIVLPPSLPSETGAPPDIIENGSASFLPITASGSFVPDRERVYNAGAIRVLIRSLLLFTPKVQLEVLNLIEKLARAGPFNQENLTSAGCVELLLETIYPFLLSPSSLFTHALKIVEVLGAYRLTASELRVLVRYILQMRLMNSGRILVDMMERLILMEDTASGSVSMAPFVEMDMSKMGHSCIQVSLGERSWPPAAGYSFVCWFQYRNFLKSQARETEVSRYTKRQITTSGLHVLRIFSVGAVDSGSNTFYAELCLQDDGILTLATSNSSSLSFSGLEMEEGRWHHLAVVHSKPNALAGLFQASVAYVYLNGKLRHTGKLGYSPSPAGKSLQVTIGTPVNCARISELSWKLRSCCLFEEVLTPGSICFMYILGRGYRGLFQDSDLLRFVPNQACSGGSMAILDSLDTDLSLASNPQRPEAASKQGSTRGSDCSGIVWDLERLGNLSLQLSGKKLIFAFDGTCTEAFRASGTSSMLNLVDPLSAAASPIGGIPRFGRLHGDIYICKQCVIGDIICPIGGIAVVLALVEAAETRNMLHMSLMLLACALHQNPQNVRDMQTSRGYHLLALFLHRRMSLFDMQSLEIFFQIAACEASFAEPKKLENARSTLLPVAVTHEMNFEDLNFSKFRDEFSSAGAHGDMDDFSAQKDSFSHVSELENTDMPTETSSCIVLSNADMVEHVLLDWTLWVNAPVSIQISLLGFLEHLVSMHWYRNHNLTILRRINLVQHLLVTMQRGDVEVPVLEKLVVLLGVILEDGFLTSELEHVVRFVIMTFDPPELTSPNQIMRESMGKHVIVRNMLLEMLIDLQVTIKSEELLEQWHKIVSSKLITYFLDEAVHPTSMRWVMTLLGACLASSPTFALKFRTSGGYQGLRRMLPSFYDSPDIYYILFCLILGKPVYPRLPEVRLVDFHALMPSDGNYRELKFVELLDSVIAMVKSTFDRLYMQSMLAYQTGKLSHDSAGLVAELVEGNADVAGELQGEALMHKTYAARLMGGEASAPSAATSVLRFMVDLAKMCPPFSAACRRAEFLETWAMCNDYENKGKGAAHAVKMAKELSVKTEDKNLNACDDADGSNNTLSHEQDQSVKTSISTGNFPQGQVSMNPEDIAVATNNLTHANAEAGISTLQKETSKSIKEHVKADPSLDGEVVDEFSSSDTKGTSDPGHLVDSQSSTSVTIPDSPRLCERSNSKIQLSPASSPVVALTSWLGGATSNDSKAELAATPLMESSLSMTEFDSSFELNSSSQGQYAVNTHYAVNLELLLEMDDSGYGGGPCSAGASAILDFIAEVLSDFITEQMKAVPIIENILESVPLYVDVESVLVFQGLCLMRLMNFLERRLLRDDEENEKRLDKSRWSLNLDALSWMIVDRVYMGGFPQASSVLKTLEFLFSMLQLANKDGRIEESAPGKGLLYIGRGSKQLDAYIHSLLKNMNRMILYCFLPSFLITIGEDGLLACLTLQIEPKKRLPFNSSEEDAMVDICTVLQLLVAHKRIIFCPSNVDTDLNCCLCINLISLLRDQRRNAQDIAVNILKYLLIHRRATLEDLLVSKPNQGQPLDVLHGGLDKLLTESLSSFFEWLHSSEQVITKVLEKCACIMWVQYITGSAKFPGVRIKGMDGRRKREMGRKSRDAAKLDLRHWEQVNERRIALELVREAMATELRVVRQDKYGWVLHAESEWQIHLEQLVHERGIFPMRKPSVNDDPEWQLCPIEGPYRMRKKLERSKLKIDTIQNVLDGQLELREVELSKEKDENDFSASDADSEPFFNTLTNPKDESIDIELYDESIFKESDDARDAGSSRTEWNDDEASLHSAAESGVKSSAISETKVESVQGKSFSSVKTDELKVTEDKLDKEMNDNGEYLIRPYLEPLEKIKHRYNSERVVGLDKHDGIFLIGELCLYVIENFYIDDSGCICEKESEDGLSVIDQALGVKKDFPCSMDSISKSTSSWGTTVKAYVGGRAWAYNGGAWGKENVSSSGNMPHHWRMWKLNSVHEILKRDYQLRPVAIEIFSMDGCNDLLVFHKKEREEVFKNLVAMNLPRNSMYVIDFSFLHFISFISLRPMRDATIEVVSNKS